MIIKECRGDDPGGKEFSDLVLVTPQVHTQKCMSDLGVERHRLREKAELTCGAMVTS